MKREQETLLVNWWIIDILKFHSELDLNEIIKFALTFYTNDLRFLSFICDEFYVEKEIFRLAIVEMNFCRRNL